ncbi:unnamed protein product (macronuclear) [Paramecium tetraurelia]|uniref:Transmembrane protein n=1 Tax=Paramecium tetraurelia TaxID=5888 RepID=A0CI89_PARTE|nr:uncharacterized protein GSPATT00007641001 [Paramecium tetraurelia]CAK70506.1 unnamed protein product [Paramecium tetraurelia]|eukprot:XP_001437903.1 hypothetical protein (macronuclear) [Paramecium tetraurelia strain d4-2]
MLFIFLQLFILTNCELIQILTRQEAVLDVFSQSGIILEQQLTEQQLCKIIPQQLVANNIDDNSITLINSYSDDNFSEVFEYGSYKGKIGKILKFVQIKRGILVLRDDGELYFLRIQGTKFKQQATFQLSIDQQSLQTNVFMEYFYDQNSVLIIGDGETIALDLEFDDDDLFIKQYKVYEQWQISHINSIATAGNLIIVAMNTGIKMFEFANHQLSEIFLDSQMGGRIQDIKVFNQNKDDNYYIYLLDEQYGVSQYIYNVGRSAILQFNAHMGQIPQPGEILDVYGDILMIVQNQTLFEFRIDYSKNSYELIKQHDLETDIIDIQLTDTFAIIIGRNGHQILFHSIPSTFSQFEWMNQLVIPNLKQLDILSLNLDLKPHKNNIKNTHNIIVGITQHKLFFSKIELQQSYIECYSDSTTQEFELTYQQKSTYCKSNLKNKVCKLNKTYTIQFVEPKAFGGGKDTYLLIILLYVISIASFLVLMGTLIVLYKRYHRIPQRQKLQEKEEKEEQTFSSTNRHIKMASSKKIIYLPKVDQTPISGVQEQINFQLNGNHNNRPITQDNQDLSPMASEMR